MAKSWLAFHFQCVKSSNEHSFEQQGERIEQRFFWGEGGRPFMTYFFAQFEIKWIISGLLKFSVYRTINSCSKTFRETYFTLLYS